MLRYGERRGGTAESSSSRRRSECGIGGYIVVAMVLHGAVWSE